MDVYDTALGTRGHNRVAYEHDDDGSRMVMGTLKQAGKPANLVSLQPHGFSTDRLMEL